MMNSALTEFEPARTLCQMQSSDLASIRDMNENNYVMSYINAGRLIILGVSKNMVQQIINIIRMVTDNNVIFSDLINTTFILILFCVKFQRHMLKVTQLKL